MHLVRRNSAHDPFGFARDLLSWDPWQSGSTRKSDAAETLPARFDVKETEEAFVLRGDLPGVAKDKLELTLEDNVLTVSGSRDAEEKKEGDNYYVYERRYGSFSRSFRLPEHADASKVDADLKDGVLTISIPKKPEAQPRKIQVK